MAIVAGVDFGTLSVRVSLIDSTRIDSEHGRLGNVTIINLWFPGATL